MSTLITEYTKKVAEGIFDVNSLGEFVNESSSFNGNGTLTTRKGKNYPTLERYLELIGWTVLGDFGEVKTIQIRGQLMRDGSNNTWRYNGSLPFTTDTGTIPSEPAWTEVAASPDASRISELFFLNENIDQLIYDKLTQGIDYFDSKNMVSFDSQGLVHGDDVTSAINEIKADGYTPFINKGNWLISDKLIFDGQNIAGVGMGATLQLTGNTFSDHAIEAQGEALLEGFRIIGLESYSAVDVADLNYKINGVNGTEINDRASILATLNNISGVSGVYISGERTKLRGLFIEQMSDSAFKYGENASGSFFPLSRSTEGCVAHNNMIGFNAIELAEYHAFANNASARNFFGVVNRGGNNSWTGNKIQHNRVNFSLLGGLNNSHGDVTGGNINHAKLCNLIVDDCVSGQSFSSVSMFDGGTMGIDIDNSSGVDISKCPLSRMSIKCRNTNDIPGINKIHHCSMQKFGVNHVADVIPSNMKMHDNYAPDANEKDSEYWKGLNNVHEDPEGWTLTESNGGNVVTARKIDADFYCGGVAENAALAIKLPDGITDTIVSFDIEIGVNWTLAPFQGEKIRVEGAFTNNTLGWRIGKASGNTHYTVYFGRDALNRAIVYIGLGSSGLDQQMRYQTMSVNNFKAVSLKSYIDEPRWYKFGWESYKENSALENVQHTFPA